MVRIYHFYNDHHYGDNILNLKFLNNLAPFLEKENIRIYYYYNPHYIKRVKELECYIHTKRIQLYAKEYQPSGSVHLWIGKYPIINNISYFDYDIYYQLFYKLILQLLEMQNSSISTSLYQKEDYLTTIYEGLDKKYKDVDILILNSEPLSNQMNYVKEDWDRLCKQLHKRFKIVTSTFVDDSIPCTFQDGLTIQDIGAISTHASYIVAVHSGPCMGCYSEQTKKHVKKWFIFHDLGNLHHQIPAVDHATIEDVSSFFNNLSN